jgi:hypothetical protein
VDLRGPGRTFSQPTIVVRHRDCNGLGPSSQPGHSKSRKSESHGKSPGGPRVPGGRSDHQMRDAVGNRPEKQKKKS